MPVILAFNLWVMRGHFKQKRQRIRFKFFKDPSGEITDDGLVGGESGGRKTNFTSWQTSRQEMMTSKLKVSDRIEMKRWTKERFRR